MTQDPVLSIIIPNYNYGRYLPESVGALLGRGKSDVEIIVVDDASTDGSMEILEQYAAKHPEMVLIKNEKNLGAIPTFNIAIKAAKGKFLHFGAADDFREENFIERSLELLEQYSQESLLVTNYGFTMEETGRRNKRFYQLLHVDRPVSLSPEKVLKALSKTSFWVPTHTSFVKRELISNHLFNESLREKFDWYSIHKIALLEGLTYIPETLSYWYMHSNSLSSKQNGESAKALIAILKKDQKFRKLFIQSTLLRWVFDDSPWDFFKDFRLWGALPRFAMKTVRWHLEKLFQRKG